MYKRVLLYLRRKPKKTFILLCILAIISSVIMCCFAVYKGSQESIEVLRKTYGGSFSLTAIEYEDLIEQTIDEITGTQSSVYRGEVVNDEVIDKIMSIDGITEVSKEQISYRVYFKDIDFLPGLYTAEVKYKEENPIEYEEGKFEWENIEALVKENNLHAYNTSKFSSYFQTNTYELIEGRHIEEEDKYKIMISDELAERNYLALGDKISAQITQYQIDFGNLDQVVYEAELEIIGIYHVNAVQITSEFTAESDIAGNYMISDLNTLQELKKAYNSVSNNKDDMRYGEVVFFVEDPKELGSVMENVRKMDSINWEFFEIQEDNAKYKEAMNPLKNINNLIFAIVIIILGACLILLSLIQQIWIYDRKREVGILLALGNSKRNIFLQFVLENILILVVAFIFALGFTSKTSDIIGNNLLTSMNNIQQRTEEMARKNAQDPMFSGLDIDELAEYNEEVTVDIEVQPPEKIACEVTVKSVVISFGVMILVIILSISISVKKIFKLKPKEILAAL